MRHTTLRRASSRQIPRTNKLPRKAPAQRRGLAWHVDAINVSLSVLDPVSGFLKHFTTSNRGPVGLNWSWYENKEIDALAVKVQATFDEAERTRLVQKMHEIMVADGGRVFTPTSGIRYLSNPAVPRSPQPSEALPRHRTQFVVAETTIGAKRYPSKP